MMNNDLSSMLAKRIWDNAEFQSDFHALHLNSVKDSVSHIKSRKKIDIKKLIQSAMYLADSPEQQHQKAAYRIAIDSFNLYRSQFNNLQNILHVILGKLGNFPAIDFLFKTIGKDKEYGIPSAILYELIEHEWNNEVHVGNTDLLLTDFQRNLWQLLSNSSCVSVSAPTSAGKSFILQQFIARSILLEEIDFALYLVPSRALINQVSESFNSLLVSSEQDNLVSTIPQPPKELGMTRGIYVLTQERLYTLLDSIDATIFKIIVVDEAQTIGMSARGVLLQFVIEKLISKNKNAKYYFGSPFSSNPEHFSYLFPDELKSIKGTISPVLQNLITADIISGKPSSLKLGLFSEIDNSIRSIATIKLHEEIHNDESAFSYLSYRFGKDAKSLIYSGSPAKCEDIADKILQWMEGVEDEKEPSEGLIEFSDFIRSHIHNKYCLADMVEKGIGFHFGRMPTILRKAIEYYFSELHDFKYLVCTSTLLHGVNLPAKNLFILKPSEGERWLTKNAHPMESSSFWNLAGRAGRLGKEFEGNVFLVNKAQWSNDPLQGNKEQTIRSSFYDTIQEHHNEILLIANQKDSDIESAIKEKAENVFVKLYCDFLKGNLNSVLKRSPVDMPDNFEAQFQKACEAITLTVPSSVIEKNIGISPFKQQAMYDYIEKSITNKDYSKLIPPHPSSSNPYQAYVRLFSRFEKYFIKDGIEKSSKYPRYLATIALSWMRGTPYPQIIQKSADHKKDKNLSSVIRELMDVIETDLRFLAVQHSRCYNDLLYSSFEKAKLTKLISSIPSIPLYLELGACSGTMVSLIGIGVSRTTAGLLNIIAANKEMDRKKCIHWLKRTNFSRYDLPKICMHEVASILQ